MADAVCGDMDNMGGGVFIRKWARALPALAAMVAQPAATETAERRVMPASYYGMEEAARGPARLRDTMLGAHNGERRAMGVSALVWDEGLAREAARYAEEMARSGQFRHSARTARVTPSGENLWMGPRRLYDYRVMMAAFLDERALFRADKPMPDISRSGRWQDVGHYSQIIWRGTRSLGCALAEGRDNDYLVCRYFPAGNVFGRRPLEPDPTSLASSGD